MQQKSSLSRDESEPQVGVSMFNPTREHDMNPTRVFSD